MKRLILRLALPFASIWVILGLVWWLRRMDFIPDHVAHWLWPLVFVVIFLGLSVLAFLWDARRWLWPLGTGFVVQLITWMLLLAEVFETPWETIGYSLGAVAIVLFVMGVIWLVNYLRARGLERRMAEGMAEGAPGNAAELGRIRNDMMSALDMLRQAGRGRNAIYELPWFLVMGRPAAGKTVAIKNSGLGLPVRKDWVKGVGGTYTCDWFFTNELIFMDTPGKWVTEGTDEDGQKQWKTLIRLLRKYRGRRPLDGLIVVVPADDLLSKDDDALEEQAANVRDVVDLIHDELSFRFPVYLLVTKSDLVEGFVDFFRGLPAQRRNEILGWSNEDPNDQDIPHLIGDGFQRVQRRLEAYRLEMLGRIARRRQARKLFLFTEDFKTLERPLTVFADAFFQSDRYHEPPVFRGFYFSSGTQGEGAPLSKAISALSQTLGVTARAAESAADEPKRSYFLLDLFRELMVQDEGLVGRTAGHWWRQRRNTMLGAFAPAGLALLLLIFSLISFSWHKRIYSGFNRNAPEIVADLDDLQTEDLGDGITKALARTGELRTYHRKMASFSPLRSLGMRRPDAPVTEDSLDLFRIEFSDKVLRPLLGAAASAAGDSSATCLFRIDVLRSVVWLRLGKRFESSGELGVMIDDEQVREELRLQYKYFKDNLGTTGSTLLPGFSIRSVSRSIAEDCKDQGSTSAVQLYRQFQEQCREASTNADVIDCAERLSLVANYRQEDYASLVESFEAVLTDLETLGADEPEAAEGLAALQAIDLAKPDARPSGCVASFGTNYVPKIREFAIHSELLDECRARVDAAGDRVAEGRARKKVLQELDQRLEELEADLELEQEFKDFNIDCKGQIDDLRRLDFAVLRSQVVSGLRVRCLDEPDAPVRAAAPARPTVVSRRKPAPRPVVTTDFVVATSTVSGGYQPSAWQNRQEQWSETLALMDVGYSEAQREQEERRVRGEVSSYASAYAKRWSDYVKGLQLRPRKTGHAEWFRQLSSTDEFDKLLQPVAKAVEEGQEAAEEPFDVMGDKLKGLEQLTRFVETDLKVYRDKIGTVGSDLEQCAKDSDFFRRYRDGLRSGDRGNSLVDVRKWVEVNGGLLLDLLETPLGEAEQFVRSDNLLKSQWADLGQLYDAEILDRAPFAGGGSTDDPVTVDGLTALLGGATGAVVRVREAAAEGDLPPEAAEWLARAEALSELFFQPGKDELRRLRARLTIGEESFEPEAFGKKLQLNQVQISFGPDDAFLWNPDIDRQKQLTLRLFGDDASDYAFVKGVLAEKKSFVMRAVSSNYKKGEPYTATAVEDVPLAPLELLRRGLQAGGSGQLVYTIEVPAKKKDKPPNKVVVPIRLAGEEVQGLLDLMERGLEAPPSFSGG